MIDPGPGWRASSPWWLGGDGRGAGHLQTIWPALFSGRHAGPAPQWHRQRWDTPDGDFIDVDHLRPAAAPGGPSGVAGAPGGTVPSVSVPQAGNRPLLVLFHGLEGSSRSPYALAMADACLQAGWAFAVPHFRGCSGEVNRAPRAYHSGDFEEVGWILQRLRKDHSGPLVAVGVSLGGNALLRWAQEAGNSARQTVQALAAVSAPLDLMTAGLNLGRGFNRQVYGRMFLRTMKAKARIKLGQFPGLFDAGRLEAARDLWAFDDVFTGPLHGYAGVADYWTRASARPRLHEIALPALLLNARNDPFVPPACLPLSLIHI